jgi:hypothetical protein
MLLRIFFGCLLFLLIGSSSIIAQKETVGHFALGFQSGLLMPINANKGIASEQTGISNGLSFKYFPSEHFAMGLGLPMMYPLCKSLLLSILTGIQPNGD